MNVSLEFIAIVALWITTMGFLWTLHRDMGNLRKEVSRDITGLRKEFGSDIADLRERMARVEGLLEGFVGRQPEPQS